MPGRMDIVVDTKELARSLNDVSDDVQRTTSAVSKTSSSVNAMAAAVVISSIRERIRAISLFIQFPSFRRRGAITIICV